MRVQNLPPKYSKQAGKYLENLDKKTQERLKSGIEKIPGGDIIPYKARLGYFRLRIGGYRVLFSWLNGEQVFVAVIDSRGQAYKKGV